MLAMAVNPFIVSWGFQELECQAEMLKEVAEEEEDLALAIDFRSEAKKALVKAVRLICSELVEDYSADNDNSSEIEDDRNDSKMTKIRKKKLREIGRAHV